MTPVLEARNIHFGYRRNQEVLTDVSFAVEEGSNVGLVGESGAGKTTLLRILLGLAIPSAGQVFSDGMPFDARDRKQLRAYRRMTQTVFQDPYSSLDPRQTIGQILAEPLRSLGITTNATEIRQHMAESLRAVGLPTDITKRYPAEFSGGQRQRIAIARAIAPNPRVLLADEPVSALDVSTRIKVIDLLAELGRGVDGRTGMSVVLVTHDLGVVAALCDRVVILENGRVVEQGDTRSVMGLPQNGYTKRLLASVPRLPVVP
ncbi:ATP-binding cassette domain-containing protein [Alpinimonas psychrophila]|uniref:Peptide/nickel transport system ATP-binding protein n=1 Tax=Alpinimonas psychrophila TaxID=748908 RepID=A0A7W3PNG5_9MICO|nr:ATP-binding cassette domain-containing protein [Alpinimonas psychrophila]MBA8828814.1 peptide/nickel transport system ATP-binding protein [Alpinimonas psychrophila]